MRCALGQHSPLCPSLISDDMVFGRDQHAEFHTTWAQLAQRQQWPWSASINWQTMVTQCINSVIGVSATSHCRMATKSIYPVVARGANAAFLCTRTLLQKCPRSASATTGGLWDGRDNQVVPCPPFTSHYIMPKSTLIAIDFSQIGHVRGQN